MTPEIRARAHAAACACLATRTAKALRALSAPAPCLTTKPTEFPVATDADLAAAALERTELLDAAVREASAVAANRHYWHSTRGRPVLYTLDVYAWLQKHPEGVYIADVIQDFPGCNSDTAARALSKVHHECHPLTKQREGKLMHYRLADDAG